MDSISLQLLKNFTFGHTYEVISEIFMLLVIHPCDIWLWGFHKDHVYRGNIQIVPELKARRTRHVPSIDRETLHATVEHAITRFEHVVDVNRMHTEQMWD